MESGFKGGGPGLAEGFERSGDHGLAVDVDFEAVAAGGADAGDEVAVLVGQFFDVRLSGWARWMTSMVEAGSAKRPKRGWAMSGLVLFDGRADADGECGLGEGNGDAAVRDVAGGVNQLALGQDGEQGVEIGFGIEIERRRLAPDAAENDFGVLRGAEDDEFGGGEASASAVAFRDDDRCHRRGRRGHAEVELVSTGRVEGDVEVGVGFFAGGDGPEEQDGVAGVAGSARERPWSRRRECRRCRGPGWDRCLRRGFRCKERRCRR